jgi:hypothetical protein
MPSKGTQPAALLLGILPVVVLLVLLNVRGEPWVLPIFAGVGVAALVAATVAFRRSSKATDASSDAAETVRLPVIGPLLIGVAATSLLLALLWLPMTLEAEHEPTSDRGSLPTVGVKPISSAPVSSRDRDEMPPPDSP